jgi:hypothetical protein
MSRPGRGVLGLIVVVMLMLAGFLVADRMGWIGGAGSSSCQSARVYCAQPDGEQGSS